MTLLATLKKSTQRILPSNSDTENSEGNLLSGSAVLFISMTVVNAGNYLFNLILGRWLGPAAFSDLSLIVTLMLMVTFVTVTYQMTAAKFAAAHYADQTLDKSTGMRSWMSRFAWLSGIALVLFVAGGAPLWQRFFNTQSFWPFVILGVGLPIYFAQGIDRGILQGQTRFGTLSWSYIAEMVIRLGAGLFFVWLGWSVGGAVLGITLSFVATWIVALSVRRFLPPLGELTTSDKATIKAFAMPVIVVQLSQILINNSDIIIVKRFFAPEEAGLYAALALIGRVVFFATWSVVTTLFPIVAQKHQKGEAHRHLLWVGLGLVMLVSVGIVGATILFPEWIVLILFGPDYLEIAPLLWLYAVATMIYALANVVINYRLSADANLGTYLATIGGVAQVVTLWLFHDSLYQVVMLQIVLMSILLVCLLAWDLWLGQREKSAAA